MKGTSKISVSKYRISVPFTGEKLTELALVFILGGCCLTFAAGWYYSRCKNRAENRKFFDPSKMFPNSKMNS